MANDRISRVSRRDALTAMSAVGVVGLAGCLGDDADDTTTDDDDDADDDDEVADDADDATDTDDSDEGPLPLRINVGPSEAPPQIAWEGIAAEVNENSDVVDVAVSPSPGTDANIGALDRDEADVGMTTNWTAYEIDEDVAPWDEIDVELAQLFHYMSSPWVFVTDNEEWESVADIEPGSRLFPAPSGTGTRSMLTEALRIAGLEEDDYSTEDIPFTDVGAGLREGQIDAGIITFSNLRAEAAHLDELKSIVDAYLLDWPEELGDEFDQHPGMDAGEIDMTQFEGWARASDTIVAPTLRYWFVTRPDVPYDAIYAFLETWHERREEAAGYHFLNQFHMDPAFWVFGEPLPAMPFHAAAADLFDEIGIWQDEWERADD